MTKLLLQYQRRPRARQRMLRIICGSLSATVLLFVCYRFGRDWAEQALFQFRQWRCLSHVLPADFVVYDDDPMESSRLLAQNESFSAIEPFASDTAGENFKAIPAPAGYRFGPWSQVGASNRSIAFLHRRHTIDGSKRAIVVYIGVPSYYARGRTVMLYGARFVPASWSDAPRLCPESSGDDETFAFSLKPSDRLRLFAGQPDLHNSAKFTIPFELNGRPGMIEGRLGSDGGVKFERRQ